MTNQTFSRRDAARLLAGLAGTLAAPGSLPANADPVMTSPGRFGPPRRFSWDILAHQAQLLAQRAYTPRPPSRSAVPDYDSHVRLTYGAAEELPGHVRLFPTREGIAPLAVGINLVEHGQARALIDTRGLLGDHGSADPAGFRVLYPDGHADWLAFLGASYFRAEGVRGQYGLSARGVSIDTGIDHTEEFPEFTDFWIEAKEAGRLIIHALLNGPSLAGAFAIDTRREAGAPGPHAISQDIKAALFPRRNIARLGLAPMTSMFLFGESDPRPDWRGEVHDSDGLAILTGGGERIWYPLQNPAQPRLNSFRADHVKGFGLLQRDQNFDHYQDDMSFYDRRPSLWAQPVGDWGTGAVMLFAFPSISETVDNIAAFWMSDTPAQAGQRRDLAYRLTWNSQEPGMGGNARCISVLVGPGGVPGAYPIMGATRYVVDFAGDVLTGLDRASGVTAITDLPADAVLLNTVSPGQDHRWRVTLDVRTGAMQAGGIARNEFRLFLKRGTGALSETVILAVRHDHDGTRPGR